MNERSLIETAAQPGHTVEPHGHRPPRARDFVRLMRLKQWTKGAFVLVGPAYGLAFNEPHELIGVAGAFLAFGFASSACYVANDIADRIADQAHPRKRRRPIAAGIISVQTGWIFAAVLGLLAAGALLIVPMGTGPVWQSPRVLVGSLLAMYVANVLLYSVVLKHRVVIDVISLSIGFVLRVLAGCAAVGVEPSSWLLNVTFFVAMFLSLGKRLGERRTLGDDVSRGRGVQAKYTDDLLRMAVVVTGVATLVSYADYVQSQAISYTRGFNLLWLTMLPATYGVLRALVLLERGLHDDPTEMAIKDRPMQLAVVLFAAITGGLLLGVKAPTMGITPAAVPIQTPTGLPALPPGPR
jgi:decaprenyl-phosphate phosphoribosyltransferase